jgi:hypothetical protein
MIDAPRLKNASSFSIRQLAEALHPNGKFHYGEWRVGNVAGDSGDSLGLRLVGSKKGLWIDRATGESGNFVDLVMAKFGCGFRDAAEWVGRTLGVNFEIFEISEAGEKKSGSAVKLEAKALRQPLPEPEPVVVSLSGDQLKRMALAAHRLALAPGKIFSVLGERSEISPAAVRGCALEGDLGFEDDYHFYDLSGPAILFGYSHGIKARWAGVDANGKRLIRWIAGKPARQCWRQSLLRSDHQSVCIFEGETDVISALSAGIEDDASVLVVGLAGAQILPDPKPFVGKKIVVFPDPGDEGIRSSEKLRMLFKPLTGIVVITGGGLAK